MSTLAELGLDHETHATLVRRVKLISWLSFAWMTAEAVVGVLAGVAAGSIALIGWGIDSTIEGVASLVVHASCRTPWRRSRSSTPTTVTRPSAGR